MSNFDSTIPNQQRFYALTLSLSLFRSHIRRNVCHSSVETVQLTERDKKWLSIFEVAVTFPLP